MQNHRTRSVCRSFSPLSFVFFCSLLPPPPLFLSLSLFPFLYSVREAASRRPPPPSERLFFPCSPPPPAPPCLLAPLDPPAPPRPQRGTRARARAPRRVASHRERAAGGAARDRPRASLSIYCDRIWQQRGVALRSDRARSGFLSLSHAPSPHTLRRCAPSEPLRGGFSRPPRPRARPHGSSWDLRCVPQSCARASERVHLRRAGRRTQALCRSAPPPPPRRPLRARGGGHYCLHTQTTIAGGPVGDGASGTGAPPPDRTRGPRICAIPDLAWPGRNLTASPPLSSPPPPLTPTSPSARELQGVGKGTYAVRAADAFGLEHLAAGDLVREEIKSKSALGQEVRHDGGRTPHLRPCRTSFGFEMSRAAAPMSLSRASARVGRDGAARFPRIKKS